MFVGTGKYTATLEHVDGYAVGFLFATKEERRAWLRHLQDRDYDIFMPTVASRLPTMVEENPIWDETPAALV